MDSTQSIIGIECKLKRVKYLDGYIQTYEFGSGEKVLLALPGFPMSGLTYIWAFKNYDLSKVRVITLDLPGWAGFTDKVFKNNDYVMDDYIDIIKAVLESYNINQFSLLGYSFGGGLAVNLYSNLHDQISRVALISSVFSSEYLVGNKMIKLVKLAYKLKLSKVFSYVFFKRFWSILDKELTGKVSIEDYVRFKDIVDNVDHKIILKDAYELFTTDRTHFLDAFKDEKLLISYSKDEVDYFIAQSQYLEQRFPNAKKIVTSGNHEDIILKPSDKVINEILDFLVS